MANKAFQMSVPRRFGFGVPGDVRMDTPWRAETHAFPEGAYVGRAVALRYVNKHWEARYFGLSAEDRFLGIVCHAKEHANWRVLSKGNSVDPLNVMELRRGSIATVLTMGSLTVRIRNAGNPGDYVEYDSRGWLYAVPYTTAAPQPSKTGRFIMPNARIVRYSQTSSSGLAVVELTN